VFKQNTNGALIFVSARADAETASAAAAVEPVNAAVTINPEPLSAWRREILLDLLIGKNRVRFWPLMQACKGSSHRSTAILFQHSELEKSPGHKDDRHDQTERRARTHPDRQHQPVLPKHNSKR
jgi:hypothetical protein